MSRYLDLARRGFCELAKRENREPVATAQRRNSSLQSIAATNSPNSQFAHSQPPFARVLAALESRCPEHVEPDRWLQATKDAKAFLGTWGEQALALGWSNRDLLGLHTPPEHPHPSYSRLSRYDETGLIWLLQGRPVSAITETTAAIENKNTGNVTVYRKHNKPGYGPVGDSLEDF